MNGQGIATTSSVAMLRTLSLVAGISGLLVVLAYQLSLPLIAENKRIAIERALFKVIPGAVSRRDFRVTERGIVPAAEGVTDGPLIYAGYDEQGRLSGIALEAAAQGYQDVIRLFGGLTEGVMYAILLGNALSPLIATVTQPRVFGANGKEPRA